MAYIINKKFTFNGLHIVRNCTSSRCKHSIHGHTYQVEVKLNSTTLDNGQMVVDFGLLKDHVKSTIMIFNNAASIWNKDDETYKKGIKKYSPRWVEMPVSPSAESYSKLIFMLTSLLIQSTQFNNGEGKVSVDSVTVHETRTGSSTYGGAEISAEEMREVVNNIILSEVTKKDMSYNWDEFKRYYNTINSDYDRLNNKYFIMKRVSQQVLLEDGEER